MAPALDVACPICDAGPGAPCRDIVVSGVFTTAPIHLSREFHSIVAKSEGSPMAVPQTIKKPVPDVISDVHDLQAEEEAFRELEEQHDREEQQGKADFWPEED